MPNYGAATPVEYTRFLGMVDEDDPTALPQGCAALALNCRFSLTDVQTRWGVTTAIQGVNQSPITGLLACAFTPELATQTYFQAPLFFDYEGQLQVENPVGTGHSVKVIYDLFIPPEQAHMIGAQAYNRAYMAFSNLLTPLSFCGVYDLLSKKLVPYGMKPIGFGWYMGAQVLVGEVVSPSQIQNQSTVAVSNGHLYRCIQAGTTGLNQPTWPTNENGTVADGTVTWEEYTPVLANRIPAPGSLKSGGTLTALTQSAGGSFSAGQDVYIVLTFVNQQGESIGSIPLKLTNTIASAKVAVTIPALASLAGWIRGLPSLYIPTGVQAYVSSVPTGDPAPPGTQFEQVSGGPFALGTVLEVTGPSSSGIFPPTTNSARITGGQIPTPVTEPSITRSSGAGTFPAGRDVYVLETYTNAAGETLPGPASSITDTQADDAVVVTVAGLPGYSITGVNIYEADVPTGTTFGGSAFPPFSQFALVSAGNQPGATVTISASATGTPPPTVNGTGVAGNIAQDTASGGTNGTQGYRYAAILYENLFDTISGFTVSDVVRYDVDEQGWELSVFNVPTGPDYIQQRLVAFTVADGTNDGPFFYIPFTEVSDGITMTATVLPDNTSSSATFNFTDADLEDEEDVTDRLDVIAPQQCIDIYYSPANDRIVQTGVPGTYSGHWISLAADPESYYADTSEIAVGNDDGERAICAREYRGVLYSLRERSGFEMTPSTADPSTWDVNQRWSKTGPCGPRAVDVCGQFMIFVHSSGLYKYESDFPENVSKEIPKFWNTINWQAQETIWVAIDVEQHEIHIGLPVGGSLVPNVVLVLNYEEGWANPLLFSRYSGKEITIEAARKYSVWNIQAYLGQRIYRSITGQPVPVEGTVDTDQETQRQFISQLVYGSSAADGTIQAIQPGTYNDNGAGIDCQWEGTAAEQMLFQSKLAGMNLNIRGNGTLFASFLPGSKRVTDFKKTGKPYEVKLREVGLELNPSRSISLGSKSRTNERWRPRLTNGCVADAYFSLKYMVCYVNPVFMSRESSESR